MAGSAPANPGPDNGALRRAEDDLGNLLRALRIPVVFLDAGLTIRRFTPEIRYIAAIRPSDTGRPIGDFRLNIDAPGFEQSVAEAIASRAPRSLRVRDRAGRRWVVRIRPDRCGSGGAVIAFFPCVRRRSAAKTAAAPVPESPSESDLNRIAQDAAPVAGAVELSVELAPHLDPVRLRRSAVERALAAFLKSLAAELPRGGRIRIVTGNSAAPVGANFPGRCVELSLQAPGSACVPELAGLFRAVHESGGFTRFEACHAASVSLYFPSAVPAASGSETVLVADDDVAVRSLVARLLRDKGYNVLEAASGPEALRVAKAHPGPIDLLVADVRMPYMSGRELADRLQALHPELRAIYMTGHAEEEVEPHGVLAPGVVLLHKPFTRDALTTKVREVLGRSAAN